MCEIAKTQDWLETLLASDAGVRSGDCAAKFPILRSGDGRALESLVEKAQRETIHAKALDEGSSSTLSAAEGRAWLHGPSESLGKSVLDVSAVYVDCGVGEDSTMPLAMSLYFQERQNGSTCLELARLKTVDTGPAFGRHPLGSALIEDESLPSPGAGSAGSPFLQIFSFSLNPLTYASLKPLRQLVFHLREARHLRGYPFSFSPMTMSFCAFCCLEHRKRKTST